MARGRPEEPAGGVGMSGDGRDSWGGVWLGLRRDDKTWLLTVVPGKPRKPRKLRPSPFGKSLLGVVICSADAGLSLRAGLAQAWGEGGVVCGPDGLTPGGLDSNAVTHSDAPGAPRLDQGQCNPGAIAYGKIFSKTRRYGVSPEIHSAWSKSGSILKPSKAIANGLATGPCATPSEGLAGPFGGSAA